jgi:hypothetical protein
LNIQVLTLNAYVSAIHKNFGFYPSKWKGEVTSLAEDEFSVIKEKYMAMLDTERGRDSLVRSPVFGWAERESIDVSNVDYRKYSCPALQSGRIYDEAFIAPDGTWYACCYDSNNELVLGNVMTQTLDEVFHGHARYRLIEMLGQKRFMEVGGPCKTVMCCQNLV